MSKYLSNRGIRIYLSSIAHYFFSLRFSFNDLDCFPLGCRTDDHTSLIELIYLLICFANKTD